ncbi:MAG: MaoC family dehydratase [Chloroflexota bacterium]
MAEVTGILLSQLNEGTKLPEIKRPVTQEKVRLYAEASGDFNPIHIDEDFAKKTPLGGTIAHGMLVLAYVSHMLTVAFGKSWLNSGKLDVRFRNPARMGDVLNSSGKITRVERQDNETLVTCEILCRNQKGEAVISGGASVKLNPK